MYGEHAAGSEWIPLSLCLNGRVEVFTQTIACGWSALGRPGHHFKSDFPILAGQDMFSFSLGSHGSIPVQHYTSLLLASFPGAVASECGCQEESREAKEPKLVRPSCSHTHTPQTPRKRVRITRKETANQVSNHISLRAKATGKGFWQFCSFGNMRIWPELTPNYLTANYFLPSTTDVRVTPLSSWAEDRWMHPRRRLCFQVWWGDCFSSFRKRLNPNFFSGFRGGSFVQSQ